MAQQISEIKASARPRSGTGGARSVRREGRVPGIIYGDGSEPQTIALDRKELTLLIGRGRFLSTVIDLDVDGKKSRVIPREVQLDPVKDTPVHVDFQRVGAGARIRVNVPVRFINEALSPGLKRGGVLNIVRHEIEVMSPGRRDPRAFRGQPRGPGDRPLGAHLGDQAARGREARPSATATSPSPPSPATRSKRSRRRASRAPSWKARCRPRVRKVPHPPRAPMPRPPPAGKAPRKAAGRQAAAAKPAAKAGAKAADKGKK